MMLNQGPGPREIRRRRAKLSRPKHFFQTWLFTQFGWFFDEYREGSWHPGHKTEKGYYDTHMFGSGLLMQTMQDGPGYERREFVIGINADENTVLSCKDGQVKKILASKKRTNLRIYYPSEGEFEKRIITMAQNFAEWQSQVYPRNPPMPFTLVRSDKLHYGQAEYAVRASYSSWSAVPLNVLDPDDIDGAFNLKMYTEGYSVVPIWLWELRGGAVSNEDAEHHREAAHIVLGHDFDSGSKAPEAQIREFSISGGANLYKTSEAIQTAAELIDGLAVYAGNYKIPSYAFLKPYKTVRVGPSEQMQGTAPSSGSEPLQVKPSEGSEPPAKKPKLGVPFIDACSPRLKCL